MRRGNGKLTQIARLIVLNIIKMFIPKLYKFYNHYVVANYIKKRLPNIF